MDSKRQLEQQLAELEAGVTMRGQTLASHRHRSSELAKKRSVLVTEMKALRATLLERHRALRDKKLSAATAAAALADTRINSSAMG